MQSKRPVLTVTKPRTRRQQFKSWLVYELNQRGANLSRTPDYTDLRDAVERFLLRGRP